MKIGNIDPSSNGNRIIGLKGRSAVFILGLALAGCESTEAPQVPQHPAEVTTSTRPDRAQEIIEAEVETTVKCMVGKIMDISERAKKAGLPVIEDKVGTETYVEVRIPLESTRDGETLWARFAAEMGIGPGGEADPAGARAARVGIGSYQESGAFTPSVQGYSWVKVVDDLGWNIFIRDMNQPLMLYDTYTYGSDPEVPELTSEVLRASVERANAIINIVTQGNSPVCV